MSKSEVSAPVSSVASDRLALGVGWVRPGVGGIGGTQNESPWVCPPFFGCYGSQCFEGNEE